MGQVWRAFGESVTGASHTRHSEPNQDSIDWRPKDGSGPPLVLAVSDGHGGAKYTRSKTGSELAVATALETLWELVTATSGTLSLIKSVAEVRLPRDLVRAWNEAVATLLEATPLTDEELGEVALREGPAARETLERHEVVAFGSTVVAVAIAEAFIVYLQLGDGDILVVDAEGHVERPMPGDPRLFANETTSLSGRDAAKDVRVVFQALAGSPPALILAATDGYANSFRSDEDFLRVGSDLVEIIARDGVEGVQGALRKWLTEASDSGSGDDVTVGILSRPGG
jgi:serine/threonine protein phosphatase PrpC